MSQGRVRLAVLSGSPPSSRTGPAVVRWFRREAEAFGQFDIDVLDLAADPLPVVITRPPDTDAARRLAAVSPCLAAAHAFVVVTAEYNHAYPAVLKSAIDWHTTEWHAKPVGFVSYGGRSGGLRAVEQLRLVFSELHAVTIRDGVSFPDVWEQFDEHGEPCDPQGCNHAAKIMLEQLLWWAQSLGEARNRRPYTT
ncbi:NADPH-dependent FMN reductase [Streptomyces kebangsaanensis]|uniref:NADPH-dependent FMN reductase n=1 Tax=Streptomyces kebangsaanensis TaxID=864058 RepID=UPI00093C64F1|nr:NAD(P)H-dependent oxidoreductase [Streptomyces kebangsaanensis]